MALLVLFSTMSFTVEKHFCGSTLVDKAVFSEAKTCGMEEHNASPSAFEDVEENCCEEEQVHVEGQDELNISFDDLDFEQQVFLASFGYSFATMFEALPKEVVLFKEYDPPLLVTDIQLLDQIFLI